MGPKDHGKLCVDVTALSTVGVYSLHKKSGVSIAIVVVLYGVPDIWLPRPLVILCGQRLPISCNGLADR